LLYIYSLNLKIHVSEIEFRNEIDRKLNCTDFVIVETFLYGNCNSTEITNKTSFVDLNNCLGSHNGELVYPGNNYSVSCSLCYPLLGKLYCMCLDNYNNMKSSSIRLERFLLNNNGQLTC
jgi:hypothetical protein